jgi:acetyl esterase/lipase
MIPWLFLTVSIIGASFTASALLRGRRLLMFVVPYFLGAWLAGELALHHLAWQAAATLIFLALGALDAWPGVLGLGITVVSWIGLLAAQRRAGLAYPALERALGAAEHRTGRPTAFTPAIEQHIPVRRYAHPFKMREPGVERIADIAYGSEGKRNLLDVYRPASRPTGCPILLQIHGGAWVLGEKDQQGLPLMSQLTSAGWVCVAPNYRLSPKATFPDHLIDVKRALAWVREHAASYGGDPDFVAITGGSAGGHLAALVALTPNAPELQPGFERIDTSVAACVPFYGIYDFLDRYHVRGMQAMTPFLARTVMKCKPHLAPERWEQASPISHVRPDAPPFFVIHGTHDSLAFVEDARIFVRSLRAVSKNPVLFAEIPGAQHAFDVFRSLRCQHAVNAVQVFLERTHARHQQQVVTSADPARAAEA